MLVLAELPNNRTIHTTENARTAGALTDGSILISSAASRESINKEDIRSILLHHSKDMLLPLQEATWVSLAAAMVPSNLEHHHPTIINHHHLLLPQRPRHTNRLQMPTLHQLQPNSARLHHLHRRATTHMI
jgi:hypothetical protein